MKKLSKDQLADIAVETMKFNEVGQCFITCDGTPFLTKNTAGLHAYANKMEVHTYGDAPVAPEPKKIEDQSMRIGGQGKVASSDKTEDKNTTAKAADQINLIEKAKSESEVAELLGTDQRATVKKAAEKRLTELNSISARGDEANAEAERVAKEQKEKAEIAAKIEAMKGSEDVETLEALYGEDANEQVKAAYDDKLAELTAEVDVAATEEKEDEPKKETK